MKPHYNHRKWLWRAIGVGAVVGAYGFVACMLFMLVKAWMQLMCLVYPPLN